MFENKRSLSLLLECLEADGHLSASGRALAADRLRASPPGPHWATSALLGAGAWIAAVALLMGVCVMNYMFMRHGGMLFSGLVAMAGGLLFSRAVDEPFCRQLSRALLLAGQVMVTFGGYDAMGGHATMPLLAAAGCALLHALPVDGVSRFLSAGFAIFVNQLYWLDLSTLWSGPLVALTAAFVTAAFTGALDRRFRPAAYAAACMLPALLVERHWSAYRFWWPDGPERAALVVALLYAIGTARRGLAQVTARDAQVATYAVGAVAILGSPGLLASGLLLVLGHDRQDRVLVGLGALSFCGFLSWYYQSLHLTLAVKSAALITSGLVLLATRLYVLDRRGGVR